MAKRDEDLGSRRERPRRSLPGQPRSAGIDLTVEGIVDRIMGIGRRIKRSMDETLSGFDLTWGEWTVLGSLGKEKPPIGPRRASWRGRMSSRAAR